MKYVINQTDQFSEWLQGLIDIKGQTRIMARIRLAGLGNFGDCKPVGAGLSEMRIDVGPGYRVYFGQTGQAVYLLISGGDKSDQKKDIARAKQFWSALKGGDNEETN